MSGGMDGGGIGALKRGPMQYDKPARKILFPTEPSLAVAGVTKAPLSGDHNQRTAVDDAKVSSPDAKRSRTGRHRHSCGGSNVSRKYTMSGGTEDATELKRLPTPINLFEDECVFCHSFRTCPEFHGPMVRYLKGRIMSLDEGNSSNGIYVHKKCLDWAPAVYYEGDIVMGLESEISRASRLRCSRCRLLGAALGCYYEACKKSFHVPCALQIFECRWDVDDRLVLCPEHMSKPLPCDELNSHTKENGSPSSLPQSQSSHNEESFTNFHEEGRQSDQRTSTTSVLPVGQYTDKEANFADNRMENQQTDRCNASNASLLPQNQRCPKEGISTTSSVDAPKIDQPDTSSSSFTMDQHSDDKGISMNCDRQTYQHNTSNLSSMPQNCHPNEEGMPDACQAEEIGEDQLPDTPRCPSDQLVLLGWSLSASEKESFYEFARWTNSTVTEQWSNGVTHVIVGKGAGSTCARSYEVLMAMLSGKWVVQFQWIVDCLHMAPGPEASYEVKFSNDPETPIDGPKKGRNRAAEEGDGGSQQAPEVFSGLRFCLSAYMDPGDRRRVRDLIAAAGGQVLEAGDGPHSLLESSDGASPAAKPYLVFDGGAPREFTWSSLIDLGEAAEHAAAGAPVVSHLRVMDAVAACDAGVLDRK